MRFDDNDTLTLTAEERAIAGRVSRRGFMGATAAASRPWSSP